jgi:hypothetical protein
MTITYNYIHHNSLYIPFMFMRISNFLETKQYESVLFTELFKLIELNIVESVPY